DTGRGGWRPQEAGGLGEGEGAIPLTREETRRVGRRESSVACDGPAPGHYEEETSPQRRQRCRMAFGCVQSEGLSHGGSCRARAVASSAARTRALAPEEDAPPPHRKKRMSTTVGCIHCPSKVYPDTNGKACLTICLTRGKSGILHRA